MISRKNTPSSKSISLVFIFILTSFVYGQKTEQLLDRYIDAYYKAKNIPSVCVGASVNGKLQWTKALGYADVENSVKTSTKTVYRIASVSKPITAIAVMQLVEKGKIKLDDDIRKYVPYFPKKKWDITIRQILSHMSGIRSYRPGEFDSKNSYMEIKDAIMVFANDTLETMPGLKYNYNTISFNLLAAVIENVSNLSFGEYLKKNIFEPAGMSSSKLEMQAELVNNRARGYVNTMDSLKNAPLADLSFKYPGGGILSTIEDLLKLGNALLENKLISKASLEAMCTPAVLNNGEKLGYGLGMGFGIDTLMGKFYGHAGGGTGFSSHFVVFPDSNAVFAFLINTRSSNLDNPALDIANVVLSNGNKEVVLNKYLEKLSKK